MDNGSVFGRRFGAGRDGPSREGDAAVRHCTLVSTPAVWRRPDAREGEGRAGHLRLPRTSVAAKLGEAGCFPAGTDARKQGRANHKALWPNHSKLCGPIT